MLKISVLYYSRFYHVKNAAEAISDGISDAGLHPILIPVQEAEDRINELNDSHAIIFGSPTYFGAVASELKAFLDKTGDIFWQRKWQNKIAAGFTHSAGLDGSRLSVLTQLAVFAMQHGMIWVGLDLLSDHKLSVKDENGIPKELGLNRLASSFGLMTQSGMVNEVTEDDLATAKYFGNRVASITAKFFDNK
ncbi:NAD(P)H dehydrogenase (quinone) [Alphaproteobacteria bacterium]